MNAVGTVIVELNSDLSSTEIRRIVKQAMRHTPSGRTLSIVFEVPKEWKVSKPVEAIVNAVVLSDPKQRVGEQGWLFSGNLCVRACRVEVENRNVAHELSVLMFRRIGPKVFERKSDVEKGVLIDSLLNVGHPAFTRDVANNVWHLPLKTYKRDIRERLSMLLTWSDERTLIMGSGSKRTFPHKASNLELSLIGAPRKIVYEWAIDQLSFFS